MLVDVGVWLVLVFEHVAYPTVPAEERELSLLRKVHTGSGNTPLPLSFLFSGYLVSFLGIKNLEYEVDHSPPPNAEVKNEWSYTSTPPTCLHAMHRVNFAFTFSVISFHKLNTNTQLLLQQNAHFYY
jgi:hypothetical protein